MGSTPTGATQYTKGKQMFNAAGLRDLSKLFDFKIHGDCVVKHGTFKGLPQWDLEFTSTMKAAAFAQSVMGGVVDVELRDPATSLWNSVVLIVTLPEESNE